MAKNTAGTAACSTAGPAEAGQDTGRRRRDAAATRRALLRGARNRFVRLGYERTTLRDVAADAGVNLALIKRYFESKEGLFEAALESTPQFLADVYDERGDPAALAETLSRQLSPNAWPETGEHPVLMFLRGSGDARTDVLRRQALQDASVRILRAAGRQAQQDDQQLLLRAELMVALGVGIAVLHSTVGLQPLLDTTPEDLLGPLRAVIDALFVSGPDDAAGREPAPPPAEPDRRRNR